MNRSCFPYINQCTVLLNYLVDQDVNPYMHLFGKEGERRPLTWKSDPTQKNDSCSYCGAKDLPQTSDVTL